MTNYIALIFSTKNQIESILQLLKLMESVSCKIDKLINLEFGAAFEYLKQAKSCKSEDQRNILFQDARRAFTKATQLEKQERLIYSYIGLATCHYNLRDFNNYRQALLDLLQLKYSILLLEDILCSEGGRFVGSLFSGKPDLNVSIDVYETVLHWKKKRFSSKDMGQIVGSQFGEGIGGIKKSFGKLVTFTNDEKDKMLTQLLLQVVDQIEKYDASRPR